MILSRSLLLFALSNLASAFTDTNGYFNTTSSPSVPSSIESDMVSPDEISDNVSQQSHPVHTSTATSWITTTTINTDVITLTCSDVVCICETRTIVVPKSCVPTTTPTTVPANPTTVPVNPTKPQQSQPFKGTTTVPQISKPPKVTTSPQVSKPPPVTTNPPAVPTTFFEWITITVIDTVTVTLTCTDDVCACSKTTITVPRAEVPTSPPEITPPPVITQPVEWVTVTVIDTVTVTLSCTDVVCACSTTTITVPESCVPTPPKSPEQPKQPEVQWVTITVWNYETVTLTCTNEVCARSTTTITVPKAEVPAPTTTPVVPPAVTTTTTSICPNNAYCKTYTYTCVDYVCNLLTKTITVTDNNGNGNDNNVTPPPTHPPNNNSTITSTITSTWTTSIYWCRNTKSEDCGFETVTCIEGGECTNDFITTTITYNPTPSVTGPGNYVTTTVIGTETVTLTCTNTVCSCQTKTVTVTPSPSVSISCLRSTCHTKTYTCIFDMCYAPPPMPVPVSKTTITTVFCQHYICTTYTFTCSDGSCVGNGGQPSTTEPTVPYSTQPNHNPSDKVTSPPSSSGVVNTTPLSSELGSSTMPSPSSGASSLISVPSSSVPVESSSIIASSSVPVESSSVIASSSSVPVESSSVIASSSVSVESSSVDVSSSVPSESSTGPAPSNAPAGALLRRRYI
ncbi:unnamed protein product [Ambrosiozyma monospora]|uniref:Unnamed protein product n=1 Tax=Ambrosiozyma monospora TaxID=43982 RepID=A0A9W6Z184_AMBMO|nr:unnamed protein product [Ambrosiozyma monospora]